MDSDQLFSQFSGLFEEDKRRFEENKPKLLAHYTSIDVLEKILKNEEVWLSNPLFMNDVEEMHSGFRLARESIIESKDIRESLKTKERYEMFCKHFYNYVEEFEKKYLIDTYIFCMSEHDDNNDDGRLSMWRGYGAGGNGAAIVFDWRDVVYDDANPFRVDKVIYGTMEKRKNMLSEINKEFCKIINRNEFGDEILYIPAYVIFQKILNFAIYTKHDGFSEEREWRIVFYGQNDKENKYMPIKSYRNGEKGIEPIMKVDIKNNRKLIGDDFNLFQYIYKIILGPTAHGLFTDKSFERMLTIINREELIEKVFYSSIPLRKSY